MYNLYGSYIIGYQSYEPWFPENVSVFAGKKYKPVALKTKLVLATLPDKFRIIKNIYGDPLANMPNLSPTPPHLHTFPPFDIPVIEHTPWVLRNILIPPGIYVEIC